MASEQKPPTTPTSPGAWVNVFALIAEEDLAARWHKSPRTLQRYRADGTGPAWIRIGGSVLYRLADVLAFEETARKQGRPE